MKYPYFSTIALTLLMAGCAYTTAVPLKSGDTTTEGFRIPELRPLLVVQNSQASILMVPNPDRGSAVRFGAFLAKNDCELDAADNQQFTKVHCVLDSTALPVELVKVLENAATAKLPLGQLFAGQIGSATGVSDFQIFAILFDTDGNITGLKALLPSGKPSGFVEMPAAASPAGAPAPAPAPAAKKAAAPDAKSAPAPGDKKDPNNPTVEQ